ncbi:FAD-dependent oxidoreductase, partial [Streptomyces beijiangensis]
QGGMLDLHTESGQAALHAAGLWEEFLAAVHTGGEAMRIVGRDGTVLLAEQDDGSAPGENAHSRPEIDRTDLRRILLGSLPAGTVRWGAKATGATPLGGGRHAIEFADGRTVTTDFLIGADGAWSRIRPLLSDATPLYSGVSFVEADLHDAAVRHPATAELVGQGMMFALHGQQGLLTHLETDGSVHAYIARRVDADWLPSLDFTDTGAARAAVLQHFDGWDDRLRALIADADGPLTPRAIHALPIDHRWPRTPGVTLLGDAAHLMSPFAGEGANLAMLDGAELATALADHPDDPEKALARYEEVLFPRSSETAAQSAESLDIIFSDDSPRGLLEMFTAVRS